MIYAVCVVLEVSPGYPASAHMNALSMVIDELFDKCSRDLVWIARKMREALRLQPAPRAPSKKARERRTRAA